MTPEQEKEEAWFMQRLGPQGNSNAGYLVETKTGLTGRTYHKDEPVKVKGVEKVKVYTNVNGKSLKMLCDPTTLKHIGFID